MRWLDGYHQLDGHEFESIASIGDGQGGLACCDSWDRKESDTTERPNYYYVFTYVTFFSLDNTVKQVLLSSSSTSVDEKIN